MEELLQWHYADDTGSFGPYALTQIKTLISDSKITATTMLWKGQGEWKMAKETELGYLFISVNAPIIAGTTTTVPSVTATTMPAPPSSLASAPSATINPSQSQTAANIHNRFVWALTTVPIIGILIYAVSDTKIAFFIVFFILNSLFFWLDQKMLKERNRPVPANKWTNVIPVYLWQRAQTLHQAKFYFWIWMITFGISLCVIFSGHTSTSTDDPAANNASAASMAALANAVDSTPQTAQEANAAQEANSNQ
ncbi:MAG: DUF4339 domain-containing protein [Gammaproteobacteria bacterium]|nr:DUF4339 domain-containing protein [Gammaproteobacteria bacterium]